MADPRRALMRLVPLLLGVLLITALGLPLIIGAALRLDLWLRIVIAVAVLVPLGVLLGMPFPLGLQIVSGDADALVPWAWGVNGFFTVIGTVSALILGMAWGFKLVLLLGAGCYVLSLVALRISQGARSA